MMPTITFHGHACFLIEHGHTRLIIDPFLTGNPAAVVAAAGIAKLDAVLVTHGHGDHLGDAVALAKRDGALLVAPYELAEVCGERGAPNVHAMAIGGAHDFPFGRLKVVNAVHGGTIADDTRHAPPCGYVLTLGGTRVYHCGDTALTMDMQLLEGRVDVMLVPIGDNYTMGVDDAAQAVGFVKPKTVIPMHYGTFPVIAVDPEAFRRAVGARAEVVILRPGESWRG